jgi:hypothetical protein
VSNPNDVKLTTSQKKMLDTMVPLTKEAYLFGYPLMVIEFTRRVMTNVPKAGDFGGPMNMIVHERVLPDGESKKEFPNVDVLEFSAWFTVLDGPMVLSMPNVRGRFYCVSLYDAWGRIFKSIGTRSTGEWKGNYALVGHGYKAKLPKGVIKVDCPTNIVRVVGKVQCHLKDDVGFVDELQNKIVLTPLGIYGKKNRVKLQNLITRQRHHHVDRTIDTEVPPSEQVDKMDPIFFFQTLSELMKDNPPPPNERPFVESLGELGIRSGHSLDLRAIDRVVHIAIDQGTSKARIALGEVSKNPRVEEWDIWTPVIRTDDHTGDHFQRAYNLSTDLGLHPAEDVTKFTTGIDGYRKPLDGNNKYIMHFPKDALPPVNAFWSLTLYDSKKALVKNRLDRFAIGSLDKPAMNEDGSLELYIQSFSPGNDREMNWLPSPMEGFTLCMSLYWPKDEVLSKKWTPPSVTRVELT